MLRYFQKVDKKGNPVAPAASSNPPQDNGSKNSKDKPKDSKTAATQPQSKQGKEVKSDPKESLTKNKNNKMEEEKPASLGRRSQTPKSPEKTKKKEKSPSPPRSTRSSNSKPINKKDEILGSSKKQPTPTKIPQVPKKEEKKPPQQNKPNNKKNKMEVENSGTEELDGSATESLTEPALSESEEVVQKKVYGGQKKKIVDSSEDEVEQLRKKQVNKPSQQKAPIKPASKKDNKNDDYDEEEEEEEEEKPRGRNMGQPKRLVKGGAKKTFNDDEDDEEEEEKDEVVEIKKTTNRTKAIEEKQQQPKQVANKGVPASKVQPKPAASKGSSSNAGSSGSTSSKLSGHIIVFTGDFNGVSRETLAKIVTDHGAKNTGSVSGKTTLLVHGSVLEDGRPPEQGKKYQTAVEKKTRIMNQSEFSDFLKDEVGQSLEELANIGSGGGRFERFAANKSATPAQPAAASTASKQQPEDGQKKKLLQPINKPKEQTKYDPKKKQAAQASGNNGTNSSSTGASVPAPIMKPMANPQDATDQLWTHKHAPDSIASCVGNEKNFEKMMEWLADWIKVVIKGEKKVVKNAFYNRMQGQGDNTSNVNAKACLLSGPPGVGKTTSVRLIAQFMGYEIREWNASDQRSKKSVNSIIGELKSNSILHLLKKSDPSDAVKKADEEVEAKSNKKFIILMDEVDGMSSGDRGGNQALIDAIKHTNVPIFCICNDRMNPKVRSLANYCYDIKFVKPPKQDIAKYMKKIVEKEGFTDVETEAIEMISERFGNDLRQTLNYLEMHFKTSKRLRKSDLTRLNTGQKDATVMLSAFDASTQLMQSYKFQKMTLRERIELFFIDYDLIPLLVHQNYLDTIQPKKDNCSLKELQNLVDSTASIAESDLLSSQIRSNGNWSLLPNFAFLSSIYPCDKACEDKPIYPKFPEWLGKFQTTKKTTRELKEFRVSISKAITGSRFAVKFDYIPVILKIILAMLKKGGDQHIEDVLDILEYYHIKPEHLKEHLNDLQYPKSDYYGVVPSDVKSKLTRQYNKRYTDSSNKIKGAKKTKKDDKSQGKYDKNLDDIVYSETEEVIPGSGAEDGDDDDGQGQKKIQKPKQQKKTNDTKKKVNKKGKSKESGTEDLSQDEDETNSIASFIDDDE